MKISAVIPTFNRRERLSKVLAALDAQSCNPDDLEVVVVDDGSKDGTYEWLSERRYRFELRALRQANAGPAHARNSGIDAATGTLMLFLDDDVVPVPSLVAEHLHCHALERDLVVIGPLASLDHYAQPWVAWEQAKLEAQYRAMQRGDWEASFRQFWTGNASVARSHLLGAGKFDTTFLRGEDVELGLRLAERGLRFRFNPQARGLHHAERSLESWENAHKSYGRLEVRMLESRGDQVLMDILGGNWSRMHPSVRFVTELCTGDTLRYARATETLRSFVKSPAARHGGVVVEKLLSIFANLLYWRASFDALGVERSRALRQHAAELRRNQK